MSIPSTHTHETFVMNKVFVQRKTYILFFGGQIFSDLLQSTGSVHGPEAIRGSGLQTALPVTGVIADHSSCLCWLLLATAERKDSEERFLQSRRRPTPPHTPGDWNTYIEDDSSRVGGGGASSPRDAGGWPKERRFAATTVGETFEIGESE